MSYNLTTMQSIYHNQDEIVEITYNNSSVYHKSSGPDYTEPFYVENISNENETLSIKKGAELAPTLTIEYSTDKATWNAFGTTSTTALTRTLAPGDKVYLRCSAEKWTSVSNRLNSITGVSKVGGNAMSLLYGSNFTGEETNFQSGSTYIFSRLFYNNNRLIDASKLLLPATTLTNYCYDNMFYGCTSLTTAPELPATTLATFCYSYMFYNCSSLTTAPTTLPATTLADNCYNRMFEGCTALTSAPALPATTVATNCYLNMFYNCSSLTTAPTTLPATTLANNCYSSMFYGCTSLTTAPELPATTLIDHCYFQMFYNCTLLRYVKCLATDISASSATSNWLNTVSSSGTFVKKAGVTWPTGTSGIPSRWTVVKV